MKKQFRLTRKGVDELQSELDTLVAKRSGIADDIKTAREQGDLAENAEYQAARAEQERNEARIAELENIIQNVEIIKKPRGDSKVQLGSTVKLKGEGGKAKEFQIVGTVEANPLSGKISDESPIGQAMIGKKVGDAVEINTPNDTHTYKIVDIS
ncbi:MAG TPA: transcription elongation factor GreA [Candidatus Saccharimonadales bacterium]|nr:transcription elongation factor GreA [Candidatus Saccharimonadales bacterium]